MGAAGCADSQLAFTFTRTIKAATARNTEFMIGLVIHCVTMKFHTKADNTPNRVVQTDIGD